MVGIRRLSPATKIAATPMSAERVVRVILSESSAVPPRKLSLELVRDLQDQRTIMHHIFHGFAFPSGRRTSRPLLRGRDDHGDGADRRRGETPYHASCCTTC